MKWTLINTFLDKPSPRSYHSSEIFEKFLIIFGGEYLGDLNDLYVLDLSNGKWYK